MFKKAEGKTGCLSSINTRNQACKLPKYYFKNLILSGECCHKSYFLSLSWSPKIIKGKSEAKSYKYDVFTNSGV